MSYGGDTNQALFRVANGAARVEVKRHGETLVLRWEDLGSDGSDVRLYRDEVLVANAMSPTGASTFRIARTQTSTIELVAFGPSGERLSRHLITVGPHGVSSTSTSSQVSNSPRSWSARRLP